MEYQEFLGQNSVRREGDLIVAEAVGDQVEQSTHALAELMQAYISTLQAENKPVLCLCRVDRMGKTTPEARRAVAVYSRVLDFDRFAVMGGSSAVMYYTQNLILKAVGLRSFRYFETEEAARAWLDEARKAKE